MVDILENLRRGRADDQIVDITSAEGAHYRFNCLRLCTHVDEKSVSIVTVITSGKGPACFASSFFNQMGNDWSGDRST